MKASFLLAAVLFLAGCAGPQPPEVPDIESGRGWIANVVLTIDVKEPGSATNAKAYAHLQPRLKEAVRIDLSGDDEGIALVSARLTALGVEKGRIAKRYRSHFLCAPGAADPLTCQSLRKVKLEAYFIRGAGRMIGAAGPGT